MAREASRQHASSRPSSPVRIEIITPSSETAAREMPSSLRTRSSVAVSTSLQPPRIAAARSCSALADQRLKGGLVGGGVRRLLAPKNQVLDARRRFPGEPGEVRNRVGQRRGMA